MTKSIRQRVRFGAVLFVGLSRLTIGLLVNHHYIQNDEIYKKYLGESYTYNKDEKFSLMISNHTSWIEIVYYLFKFTPGFISKDSVKKMLLVGFIAQAIDSLFIDRKDQNSKHLIVIVFVNHRLKRLKVGRLNSWKVKY